MPAPEPRPPHGSAHGETVAQAPPATPRILQPGRNCWRLARAGRAGPIVDAADYFAAFVAAAREARRSITILGWDIYSQVRLLRDEHGEGPQLRQVLAEALQQSPDLHVHILMWDLSLLYDIRRDPWRMFRFRWPRRRRLHFHWDAKHAGSASHHQKIVIVDGRLAFCGGIDLTDHRWDTPAHAQNDPRRVTDQGKPFGPFHDVHMAVDGEAARALLAIANDRWRRVTGKDLPGVDPAWYRLDDANPPAAATSSADHRAIGRHRGEHGGERKRRRDRQREPSGADDLWPADLAVHFRDVDVAIARTDTGVNGERDVREVEKLFLDAIAAARQRIYIENQYFTSNSIGEALAARLAEEHGPEVVLVGPRTTAGWLQQLTMGTLRERLLATLRQADHADRLLACCPETGPEDACGIFVHAKVMIVDDTFLRIGSANTNNRSMGLDTECDLAIEADGDPGRAAAIRRFLAQLVGEHMDLPPEEVATRLERDPSLIALIREGGRGPRRLRELEVQEDALEALVPDESIVDPERPVQLDRMIDHFLPPAERGKAARPAVLWGAVTLLVLLVALPWLWRATPLHEWLDPSRLEEALQPLRSTWLSFLVVVAAFVVGSLLLIPISLLAMQAGIVFGPWLGFAAAMCGVAAGGAVTFGLGRTLGARTVQRLAGARVQRLGRRLAAHGIVAVIVLRNLPVAPFGLVNVMVGATPVRCRDFMLGTLLGVFPGAFLFALFGNQLARTMARPGAGSYGILLTIAALLVAGTLLVRRVFRRRAGALAAAD